jgi:hypothetical protein
VDPRASLDDVEKRKFVTLPDTSGITYCPVLELTVGYGSVLCIVYILTCQSVLYIIFAFQMVVYIIFLFPHAHTSTHITTKYLSKLEPCFAS